MNNIKHIVISGGGPSALYGFSVLRELFQSKKIDLKQLKSIHSTSSGTILALLFLLNLDLNDVSDALVEFPYDTFFTLKFDNIVRIITKQGFFNIKVFSSYLDPLLKTANVNINITLKEFYEKTGVHFHLYCTDIISFKCVDLNHNDFPKIRLKDAIYASCSIPLFFCPLYIETSPTEQYCLVDGSFLHNLPMIPCIKNEYGDDFEEEKIYRNEVLCINYTYNCHDETITKNDGIFKYIKYIFMNLFRYFRDPHEIKYASKTRCFFNLDLNKEETDWNVLFKDIELRREIIDNYGAKICNI